VSTIVGNLLDNAIKYSPAGGEIRCSVGTAGQMRFVSVADHGLGIETAHMPLLFKRFSRLPTEENKIIPGTGLALYLCQEIAHRLRGDIGVASTPHRGSEFTLRLPAYEDAA
jgi:signal transduction histidine kinase